MTISAHKYHNRSAISYVLVILIAIPAVVMYITVHDGNVIHGDFTGVSSTLLVHFDMIETWVPA
jgi:hypothetical protein